MQDSSPHNIITTFIKHKTPSASHEMWKSSKRHLLFKHGMTAKSNIRLLLKHQQSVITGQMHVQRKHTTVISTLDISDQWTQYPFMGGCRNILHGLTILQVMIATHLFNFFCGIFYNTVNISDYTIPTVGRLKNSNSKSFERKKLLPYRSTGKSRLKYLMRHCTHICQKASKNGTLLQGFHLHLRMHFSSHTCYMFRPFQWPMVQSIRSATFFNFLL